MTDQEKQFLARYMELVRELGLCIGACGCCSSPWVIQCEDPDKHEEHLKKQAK